MKRFNTAFFAVLAFSFLTALVSCSNDVIGYSVVLWNIPERQIPDGKVVPVFMKSNISKTYLIGVPESDDRVEIPLWKITAPTSKSKAKKLAASRENYNQQYAVSIIDGLPIRREPTNVAKQVYRLRKGEIIRTIVTGVGDIPTVGREKLEGEWYQVLTSTGVSGWCFSHNLRMFQMAGDGSYEFTEEVLVDIQEKDDLLDIALATLWYPEYYAKMINNREIDLKYMQDDYGFDPGSDTGMLKLKLSNVSIEVPYEGVTKTGDHIYRFNNTPIQMTIRNESTILIRYTDDTGRPFSVYFITIEDDVQTLIAAEKSRREKVYSNLMRFGPGYSSSNYGNLNFSGNNLFRWTGFENLQPAVISMDAKTSGTVESKYFVPKNLRGKWDGILSFTFNGDSRDVNFFYKMEASGLRLAVARVIVTTDPSTGRDVANVTEPSGAQVMYFHN